MKNIIFIVLCSLLPFLVSAQTKPNFVGQWYQQTSQGKIHKKANAFKKGDSDFSRTKRYNLRADVNQLNSIMRTKPALIDFVVPYGDKKYTLNLARVDVTSDDFTLKTNTGDVTHTMGVQYRGIVDNNPAHVASMSLTPSDKSAYFSTDEGNFVINNDGVEFIVYNDLLQHPPVGVYCETADVPYSIPSQRALASVSGCKIVNVYFECDYAFYLSKGSNVTTVTDYVMSFFNQVATLYANEQITIQVSSVFVWTTPDPYATLTTPSAILNSFRTTRGTNFNGNIAHFLTTRSIGGGVAFVDVVCNKPYAFGVSMVYGTFSSFPTYSWTVNVVTHELGHTLGSPHTHSCSWPGGPIDNCYTPEGGCAPGPTPIGGGTIMSYCHIINIGINFNNGFGPLPGNLIRSKIEAATCLASGSSSSPPTSLNTTNITSNSASLSWAAAPGASTYTAQYKLATASTWTTTSAVSATSINITGLTAGSNYVWAVKADCSPYSAQVSFTTTGSGGGICAAPTNLTNTNIAQTTATLGWTAVSGATGYSVQYKTSTASTWNTASAPTNSFNLSGLSAGTAYNWQVKANCSPYSSAATFTTAVSSGCAAPAQLTNSNTTQTSTTLSWGAVSGSTGYSVQYKPATSGTWTTVSATTNSITISGLSAGTSYTWQVKASCSVYSSQATFSTASSSGCTTPTQLTSSNITQSAATLSWSAVSGATGYTLQYKRSTLSTWTTVSSTSNSKTISGLVAGTTYNWQVKTNCSAYSAQSNFTTTTTSGCAAPTQLTASGITQTSATLNWAVVSGATGYTVQYKASTAGTWTTTSATTNSKAISGLVAGTSYTWQVKANCSAYSSQSNFTTNTTSTSGCGVPTNMGETNITTSTATLTWTGPANALNYSIWYRLAGASGWTIKNNISGNAYHLTNLLSKRTYQWVITTKCTNGTSSAQSSPKYFTTL